MLFVGVPTPFVAPLIACVHVLIVSARAPIERMKLHGWFVAARVVLVGLLTRRARRYGFARLRWCSPWRPYPWACRR
ncbi:MAG: hypothetical protein H0V43_02140 [Gemmatimonadales bacterium]|nr:hypothetical protein [Gemmatimonadales bacterium]